MNLFKILQDFLVLELKAGSLKYLYSGFDNYRPEILDCGCYRFPSSDWSDLVLTFREHIKRLVEEKLPSYSQLETYLIPPPEMAMEAKIMCFESNHQAFDDWHYWELSQLLPYEKEGYIGDFNSLGAHGIRDLAEKSCLVARTRHITDINAVLKDFSMFLAGILFPQALWREIGKTIPSNYEKMEIVFKESGALVDISFQKGEFARFRYCPESVINTEEKAAIGTALLQRLIDNLTFSGMVGPGLEDLPIYIFKDNFSLDEIAFIEKRTGTKPKFMPDDLLPQQSDFPSRGEYLLLNSAYKKICELWYRKDI